MKILLFKYGLLLVDKKFTKYLVDNSFAKSLVDNYRKTYWMYKKIIFISYIIYESSISNIKYINVFIRVLDKLQKTYLVEKLRQNKFTTFNLPIT